MALADILQKIEENIQAEKKNILDEALKQKEKIIEEAKTKAQIEKDKIIKSAQQKAQQEKRGILSDMRLEAKNKILEIKSQLLQEFYANFIDALIKKEHHKIIKDLIKSLPSKKIYEIIPPKGKETEVQNAFKESSLNFKLLESTDKKKGGFILVDGKIRYDYSIENLIEKTKYKIETQIIKALFKE